MSSIMGGGPEVRHGVNKLPTDKNSTLVSALAELGASDLLEKLSQLELEGVDVKTLIASVLGCDLVKRFPSYDGLTVSDLVIALGFNQEFRLEAESKVSDYF